MSKCKGCGKEIFWIETTYGKVMAVDPKLIEVTYETHGKFTLVWPNGNVVKRCSMGTQGYVPHWSCLKANDFKKKNRIAQSKNRMNSKEKNP